MQFQVPQFIEMENKIVGPLTLKQFLYLAAGGGLSFLFFFTLQTWLWFLLTLILAAVSISLAFVKYNGQPLPRVALNALGFFWKPRLYVWQREVKTVEIPGFSAESKRKNLKEYFSEMPSVVKLMEDLMTRKSPITKREKRNPLISRQESKFTVFKKLTGEKEIARRVDYR